MEEVKRKRILKGERLIYKQTDRQKNLNRMKEIQRNIDLQTDNENFYLR